MSGTLPSSFWVFMTALLWWVLLCHSRTDQKQFIYQLFKNVFKDVFVSEHQPLNTIFLPYDDTNNLYFIWYLKIYRVRMHQGGFRGRNFRGVDSPRGTLIEGNLPRETFPDTNSLNVHPPLNMWEWWL